MRLIEAVPNFSTSDPQVVEKITEAIEQTSESYVLHTDPDMDYNRTVVTFVSTPEYIIESSLAAIEAAIKLIDMSVHYGEHPRIGAVDVFPLIPIQNVGENEAINLARKIAQVSAEKFSIPVYCYGKAALSEDRRVLSEIRRGQYEKLQEKLKDPLWRPDYGPSEFNQKSGAMVVGVRNFLIAYNINLNTSDIEIAKTIARKVRTSGYVTEGKRIPGRLQGIQAMGVTLERPDRGKFTQVSTNVLDYQSKDTMYDVYTAVIEEAMELGVKVTGSEIVGLVPIEALISSLHSFNFDITKDNFSDYLDLLGLNDLYQFDPQIKVLEFQIRNKIRRKS